MMTSVEWALEPFSSFWINYLQRYMYTCRYLCKINSSFTLFDSVYERWSYNIHAASTQIFIGMIFASFCITIQPPLSVEVLVAMDKCYGFNKTQNAEIKYRYIGTSSIGNTTVMFSQTLCIYWLAKHNLVSILIHLILCRWFRLCLKGKWSAAYPLVTELLSNEGRMKYIVPLYR